MESEGSSEETFVDLFVRAAKEKGSKERTNEDNQVKATR